ncbi:uncharacterized protein LOC129238163 [Anastrepha obliqua]|uniref:uncharacterized protein LOC129238163 n=1 Tax=Anastrepha obliqua TaxID=95512 RepID=UPI0024092935|nr:uncharacterized protein LOC129238163 [Anastrepha obliqua]
MYGVKLLISCFVLIALHLYFTSYSELEEFETPARYRPDSLSALSRTTRFTEDEIKRIYRGFKAECPTGVVKEDTFKLIYSQFFPQGANPTLYAHYVFNTLDQDHSGIISFEDFVQGLSILSRGSVEEKLRWTFSLYDINGDGFITREEMTDIVTAIYELMGRLPDECPEEEKIKCKVDHIFQKMDKNGDGVVTLDEFLETCRSDEAISRSMSVFDSQQQQQTSLDAQAERDKCKNPDKRKSNKKTLQIQLPDKAQPQPQTKLQLKPQQIDALVSQNLANNSQKIERRTVAHSAEASKWHTSSSDASTASCDSDNEEAVSEKLSSMCHHCLRPQFELQLRYLRPYQRRQWSRLLQQQRSKRHNSKSRKEVSWSGGGVDDNEGGRRSGGGGGGGVGGGGAVAVGVGGYGAGEHISPTNTCTSGVHWSRRDVSAAVRYRCPQVGPKSAPYHFHHPQQLHNAYQLQLLLQQCDYVPPTFYQQKQQQQLFCKRQATLHNTNLDFNTTTTTAANMATITFECESQSQSQRQQQLLDQQQRNQNIQINQNLHAMTTATTTIKTATSSGCSENGYTSNTSLGGMTVVTARAPGALFAHPGRSTRGTVSDSELQLQQHQPTTSESPSLVKVRAWYTVAKQGVSC